MATKSLFYIVSLDVFKIFKRGFFENVICFVQVKIVNNQIKAELIEKNPITETKMSNITDFIVYSWEQILEIFKNELRGIR